MTIIVEEVDVLSGDELEKLKDPLVHKILKFCRKQNIETENFSRECVKGDLEIILNTNGGTVYKCIFDCPFCEIRTPCLHNSYWHVGNFEKHLKTHKTRKLDPEAVEQLNHVLQKNP